MVIAYPLVWQYEYTVHVHLIDVRKTRIYYFDVTNLWKSRSTIPYRLRRSSRPTLSRFMKSLVMLGRVNS